MKNDLDMRNFRIVNIGSPSSAGDAVPLAQLEQIRHIQSTEFSKAIDALETKFNSLIDQKINSRQKCECDIDRKIDVLYKVFRREIDEALQNLKDFTIANFSKHSLIARCVSMTNEWVIIQSSLIATPEDSMTGTGFRFLDSGQYQVKVKVNYPIKVHLMVNANELQAIDLTRGENDFTARFSSNSVLEVVFGDGITDDIDATLIITKI